MKGQRKKEQKKRQFHDKRLKVPEGKMPLLLTPLDLFPLEPTKENVFQYLIDSYWIESQVIKIMGIDNPIIDDTISEIYLMVYDKLDTLLEIYEARGILAFCGYIKAIVNINARYPITIKRRLFGKVKTIGMSKEMEHDIDEQYDPENDDVYHLKNMIR